MAEYVTLSMIQPRIFVIFLHIHKCAGISFKSILRHQFGPGLLTRIRNRLFRYRPLPLVAALKNTTNDEGYFAGHLGFGVHELLPSPSKYVTFLRDPAQRLISLYEYSRSTPGSFYFKQTSCRTFEDFVRHGSVFETDNGMVRFLIGDLEKNDYYICRKPFGSLTEADLQTAIRNIQQFFACPGITEHFDRSLLLLKTELGFRNVKYLKLNERAPSACVGTEWNDKLEPFVALDRQLYHWALAENEKVWNEFLLKNPSELSEFQLANQKYRRLFQRPYEIYVSLKKTFHF